MAENSGDRWRLSYSCPLGDDVHEIDGEHESEAAAHIAAQAWIDDQVSRLVGSTAHMQAAVIRMSVFIIRPEGGMYRFQAKQEIASPTAVC